MPWHLFSLLLGYCLVSRKDKISERTYVGSQPIKILIADRENVAARRIRDYFLENGLLCEAVSNGKDLKLVVQKWLPDFILTDLLLPDCSAIELLAEIKSTPTLASKMIKVMVTSSHNNVQNVKQMFAAGACDYIVKPYKVEDVLG